MIALPVVPPGVSSPSLASNAFFAFLWCALVDQARQGADGDCHQDPCDSTPELTRGKGQSHEGDLCRRPGDVADFHNDTDALVVDRDGAVPGGRSLMDVERLGGTAKHVAKSFMRKCDQATRWS